MYAQTPEGSVAVTRTAMRVPIIGELMRKIALSRFAHYFATLHESGLEVAPSLTLIEKLIGNAHLSQQFNRAVQRVMAGESLSRALRTVGEFPPVVIQMIALGERTGRMSKALEDVRRYFDSEVDRTIKRSLTLFGPILLVILAGTFVLMALAFYLPLFQLLRGIQ
jgi:type IV pilus assembly protein PilC